MKILRLRFKNIHSLKGEHLIDFTVAPLRDAGLFAITGPTGAGKSTILDVITLALFNKIPRFSVKGTESISKTEIVEIGSVITHYTNEAYAEIEYECHQKSYRSKWSISKTRTGSWRDYEMELSSLIDNKIFDLKKSEVPAENERILGLKYQQFIRSILLSQGDFARFLKSDVIDRAKLLEDITDSHIYREIGKSVFEKNKSCQAELDQLRRESKMFVLNTEEELLAKEELLLKNELALKDIISSIDKSSISLQKIDQKKKLLSRFHDNQVSLLIHSSKKEQFEVKAIQLQKHQELDVMRTSLTLWQNEKERVQKLQNDITQYQSKWNIASNELKQSLSAMSKFVHAEVTEDNFMAQMKSFENKIIQFDSQLREIRKSGELLRDRVEGALKKAESESINKIRNTPPLDQYQFALSVKKELSNYKSVYEGNLQELQKELDQIQIKIVKMTSMAKDLKQKEDVCLEIKTLQQKIVDNEQSLIIHEKEIAGIDQELQNIKYALEIAENQKKEWLKTASLDEHRQQLVDGEACPLCGSLDHPYVDHLPMKLGENEIHIEKLNQSLNQTNKKYQEQVTKHTVIKTTMHEQKLNLSVNEDKVRKIEEQYPNYSKSSDELAQEIERLNQLFKLYKAEAQHRSEKEIIEEVASLLSEIESLMQKFKSIKSERMALYSGDDINGDADKIQNTFVSSRDLSKSLKTTISNVEEEEKASVEKWNNIASELSKNLFALGYDSPEFALQFILTDSILKQILSEKSSLDKEQTELSSLALQIQTELELLNEINSDDTEYEKIKKELQDLNIEKDQINQNSGAIQNELKNQKELRLNYRTTLDRIIQMEVQYAPLSKLNDYIGDATGNKYSKFAQNLSLKHLITFANLRLVKLTDRYLLAPTDIEEDLKVLDRYQGETQRSVKTLSGGETFIVSLALALSLADMASQNVRLDSLFIDEGFGTLDQDTLEIALITLEKLQAEGNRNIGIISHVESLKERITTQIKVHKDHMGYSKIEVTTI